MKPAVKYSFTAFLLLLIWGVILVSTMPMRFVLDKVAVPSQIRVESVSGTIWNGRTRISWQGQQLNLPIIKAERTDLLWHWCPLQGLLTACVQLDNSELKGDVSVSYSPFDRQVVIQDARLMFDLKKMSLGFDKFPLELDVVGEAYVRDTVIPIDAPVPQSLSVDGKLTSVSAGDIDFGDYEFDFEIKDDLIVNTFQGGGENFAVQGQIEYEADRGVYRYLADVKSPDKSLLALLGNYATSSRSGMVTFSGSGERIKAPMRKSRGGRK